MRSRYSSTCDDAAARAAEGERRPNDRRQADDVERPRGGRLALLRRRPSTISTPGTAGRCARAARGSAGGPRPSRSPPAACPAGARPVAPERRRGPARRPGSAPSGRPGRQQAVGLFAFEDALDRGDRDGLEVDDVGDAGVGHDRGRVRVEQDRPNALVAQRPAGLRAGVVELGGLADDDRAGADDQDRLRPAAGRSRVDARARRP